MSTGSWIFNQSDGYLNIEDTVCKMILKEDTRSEATTSVKFDLLLDALCRHREILRRETDFLRGEVTSRGLATFASKKAYLEDPNGRTIQPLLLSELFSSRKIRSVVVSLPYLNTKPEESLDFLVHESDHLSYRIQSLVSILRKFGIPASSDPLKFMLFAMSRTAVVISKTMKLQSKQDATSSQRLHRGYWESIWGSGKGSHGVFEDISTLSPMLFTTSTPGIPPCSATICPALQIYSLKIVQLNVNFKWPLRVYGLVAARDTVDNNRNLLFYRSRANYQLVTENDPFLRLTGPSRAIVAVNPVTFEVELKIKYPGAGRQDSTAFFSCTYNWRSMRDTTPLFRGYACAAELSLEPLPRAIQATIVCVRLVKGKWPSRYGCRVYCYLSNAQDREVELLNCSSENLVGSDGYFGLTRNVVSAQLQSTLKVVIQGKSRAICRRNHVVFPVLQYCQTSKASCIIFDCEVEVVVGWSLLVENKRDLMLEG